MVGAFSAVRETLRRQRGASPAASEMHEELPPELRGALQRLFTRRPDLALDVRWHDSVTSTMDVAAAAAAGGAPAGFVAAADQQTAGRGRRGHAWSSPPGAGLYFSYLARPTRHLELVTLAAGIGVQEGVAAATGLRAQLKWPNDLLVERRKLAGLLAEGAHLGTPEAAVVVGVGLNVKPGAYPPEIAVRATSLAAELGRDVPRFPLFAAVIERLADTFAALDAGAASDILRRWRHASPLAVGAPVSWTTNGVDRHGITAGIDDAGALLVQTEGSLERVIAGELQWHLPDS
jgi:BirA family transcriptional regulator, biotin operon repressor / biotin---[acetyl-CoA-carboxylase] ligase